ncbi:GlxA family transcriptional regulator [Pseudomonas abietaniphila]|uniref:Transcriptional regulator, AraC family with amidase-like domain n=2 Tax=cellular organisms TaxID=131567 RepID=A0A1G7RCB8_9PSED|nr:helix-turn-helix domain-containing protein [Pseudomonas abietaniphila]SDG08373.1 transcriptional regulator, AraC family with amidase-like domain [Pseudomonas abietaniphila]
MNSSALSAPFSRPRTMLFVAYPQVGLLDLTGAQTVFWVASRAMKALGLPGYHCPTGSIAGGITPTAEGVAVDTRELSSLIDEEVDTIVVPGSPEILTALENNPDVIDWIARHSPQARRTASVCSGAFLLAQAGLLDSKRAATHWAMCDMLKSRFPTVEVDQDAIFIQQDSVWTSAGVTAGIDLALALVEEDCGRDIAMKVARELVVFMKRPGGQSQFSEMLQSQMSDGDTFAGFHVWLTENLRREDLDVETLARQANMSARNFSRVYKQKTGRSPAKALEVFRLEAARRLLEDSDRSICQIASACGFGDEERMRVTFQRHLAISPRDYRTRFSR